MELRRYWKIIRRRWLIIVIPVAIVLLFTIATYRPAGPAGYNVGVNFLVSQEPGETATNEDENRYYNWLTSEYIVNGLTDWAVSGDFKTAVSAELAKEGIEVTPFSFGVVVDNVRSKMALSISYGDADTLAKIMDAAILVLTEQNADALPQLGGETAVIVQLDAPVVTPIPQGIRAQIDAPLRLVLALIAGVGLALLIEYLDPTLRDRSEAEKAGLTIIGEIPKK